MSKLTGETRYRTSWNGKVILQVEYTATSYDGFGDGHDYTAWRDAKLNDLNIKFEPRVEKLR